MLGIVSSCHWTNLTHEGEVPSRSSVESRGFVYTCMRPFWKPFWQLVLITARLKYR